MRGRARLAALAAALLPAFAWRAPAQEDALAMRVQVPASEVVFGVAFPLVVERSWTADLQPEPFADTALSPLALRQTGLVRERRGERIVETRTYDAFAFTPGELTVPAPFFRARDRQGRQRIALADDLRLAVAPALGEGDSPEPELPGDPLPPPWSVWPWLRGAVLAALGLLLGLSLFRRLRRPPPAVQEPPPDPRQVALQELAALRRHSPAGHREVRADSVAAAGIVRRYLETALSLPAPARTTDEFLADLQEGGAMAAASRERLTRFLRHCDLVKFARHRPAETVRQEHLQLAEEVVRGTDPSPPAAPSPSARQGEEAGR